MSACRLIIKCCCVLMLVSVAGASSEKRCAHNGEAVKLLSNIGYDVKDVTLYNENGSMVASWKDNTNEVEDMDPNYSGRIYMDEKRNIWILGVERKDAGRYYIKFGIHDRFDIKLTVKEELTEEQLQECPNNHPDFQKEGFETSHYMTKLPYSEMLREGISHVTTTAQRQKDVTEEIGHDTTIAQSKKDDTKDSWISLTNGLLSAILFILIVDKILASKTYIIKFWKTGQHWIEKRSFSQNMKPEQLPQPHENTRVTIEESELTEDQVQYWLDGHPDFIEKYLGKLVEDQIQKWLSIFPGPLLVKKYPESLTADQVQGWLDLHPGFRMKYHDGHENHHQSLPPTLDELGITVTVTGTGPEDNQHQQVSTQMKVLFPETCSSQISDEDELHHEDSTPTLEELGITVTGTGTGREGISQSSDESEIHHQATPTVDELGITVKGTGREGNQRRWVSSQKKVITYETCSSSSLDSIDSFKETGNSGMQYIRKDEKKADPEGDKAQTDGVENSGESMKEDPNSDDDYSAPLLSKSFIPK